MQNTVTKKFQYGAGHGEIVNEELAIAQMRARNFLRNELVALDRKTREQYYAVVNADNPANDRILEIVAEMSTLRDEIKMLGIPNRDKSDKHGIKTGEIPQKARITELKKELQDLKPVAKAKRLENRQHNFEVLYRLNDERKKTVNMLRKRAISGYTHMIEAKEGRAASSIEVPALYHGNADEIYVQHDTERSRAMKEKTQLRFQAFRGEGRSSVRVHSHRDTSAEGSEEIFDQLQKDIKDLAEKRKNAKGKQNEELRKRLSAQIDAKEIEQNMTAPLHTGQTEEETFAGDSTLFRIDAVNLQRDPQNPTVWDKNMDRAQRRKAMRTVAHIRIQSTDKGKPIFLSMPIIFHRPLPVGAQILSAAVNREKIASTFRWNVEFTVRYNENKLPSNDGIVAIDLGWAKNSLPDADGRVRVAGVRERAADGAETFTEFCLPPSFSEYQKKLEDIHSIRDKHTNEAFAKLELFRTSNEIKGEVLRELLDKAKASLSARKAIGKEPPTGHLRSAVWMLRNEKAQAQDELVAILEAWYERWSHLNNWLQNGRDNLLTWKRDYYRRFSYQLARRNNLLLLDADNFARMAKTPAPEAGKAPVKNELRQGAAPSMLRLALESAFEKTLYATGLSSSKTCRVCGVVSDALGPSRTFTCLACGHTDDRESNATGNVLSEYLKKPGSFSSKRPIAQRLAEKKEAERIERGAEELVITK